MVFYNEFFFVFIRVSFIFREWGDFFSIFGVDFCFLGSRVIDGGWGYGVVVLLRT